MSETGLSKLAQRRPVVVITYDGLGAPFLGPYGNAAVATPNWNRLAAESVLFEFAWSDSLVLESIFRAYWTGHGVLSGMTDHVESIARLCTNHGMTTRLITDDDTIASLPEAKDFSELVVIDLDESESAANTMEETQAVRFTLEAIECIADDAELTWIHCRAMSAPWDAPFELRQNFVDDEEDPTPPTFLLPPETLLTSDTDPDLVWGYQTAYVAQLSVVDMSLDLLLDAIQSKLPNALIIVTSPRGYALGAHGNVGIGKGPLFADQLHVPCLVRHPDGCEAGTRIAAIPQPKSLFFTLVDAVGINLADVPARDNPDDIPSLLRYTTEARDTSAEECLSIGVGERSLRTQTAFFKEFVATQGEIARVELYVKPDDRWEQNEISSRCPDDVDRLRALCEARLAASQPM